MIKLIVTDMDGCLLDPKGRMPADFDDTFGMMQEKGVVFAAASGRSVAGFKMPFGKYADKMAFVTDNGACAYYMGECLFSNKIAREDYIPIFEEAGKYKDLIPVACGVSNAWMENTDRFTERDIEELKKYYPSWSDVKFEEIPEDIIKVALLYFDDIEKNIYPHFEKFSNGRLLCEVTAYVWIDIFDAGVSKGTGIRALQERLGIGKEETVIFGDYLNDLSMADYAARSYAPSNAHKDVKERFTDIIGSNEDGAVTKTIREIL